MKPSIRWRLATPFILLVTAAMVGLSAYIISYIRSSYLDHLRASLLGQARQVAEVAQPNFSPNGNKSILEPLTIRQAQLLGERVTLISSDGTVLGESDTDPSSMENHLNRPEVKAALSGGEASELRFSNTLKQEMLYVAVPIKSSGTIVGVARVAVSLARINQDLAQVRRTIVFTSLGTILVAILLSIWLSGYTLHPLSELTDAANKMASGDFSSNTLKASEDEIGEVNQAFNLMADNLRDKIDALRSEQGKLSAVLARMSDGVIIVSFSGYIQLINAAAARMFNVRETESVGKSFIDVVRHHQFIELWRFCLESGEQQTAALELPAEKLFIQGIATPLKQFLPGSTLILVQDLTRLRRLETVRQDFISNVSHELRTPLASLRALTETLQEGALNDPPAAKRFLSRMEIEIDTLTQMVQELLELSRIESGRVPLKFRAINPCDLAIPSVERMRTQADRADIDLQFDCPADLPKVNADPERIEQVMVNLLHNAIKFTPPGGKISVIIRAEPGKVIFQVKDTGVGIDPQDLPRIFERFYKTDRARSSGGTGLGLSIVRHLVESHGGKIWVESTLGTGSTFSFDLPIS